MKKFKEIISLLEFHTGLGQMDYGEKNKEEMAGAFVAKLIDIHDAMVPASTEQKNVHPASNLKFLTNIRNYYMGKTFGPNDPEHGKHAAPENMKKYRNKIAEEYPNLLPYIDSELGIQKH